VQVYAGRRRSLAQRCITCGAELHPERARKYNYCMSKECQEKNAKGLTMVAVGMNKAAEEFMILDEDTRADLASGKYRDQRRTSFGTSEGAPPRPVTSSGNGTAAPSAGAAPRPVADSGNGTASPSAGAAPRPVTSSGKDATVPSGRAAPRPGSQPRPAQVRPRPRPRPAPARPWTPKQERLALLYNEQGLRPAEIAQKLGVSSWLVTQIILAAKNRGKL
jgi:hypothetical protein